MTLTIDLAPDEETGLRVRAAEFGQDSASYMANLLRKDLEALRRPSSDSSQDLTEFLKDYTGVFHTGETKKHDLSHLADKTEEEAKARIARTLAVIDSFMEGDEQIQRETYEYLKKAIDEDRPGQRRMFGEGMNP